MVITRTKFSTKKFGTFKFGSVSDLYVLINGVEKSVYDIYIEDILTSEINTASFSIDDIYANKPECEQTVEIWHNDIPAGNVLIFAGRIKSIAPVKLFGNDFRFDIECSDYTSDLDKYLVAEDYLDKTAYYIINDILTKYTTGFTMNGVDSVSSPIIKSIQFPYLSVSECIRKLAEYTGYDWYVDYYKDIKFFALDTAITSAPIELLDDGEEFDELEMSFDNTQIRNRIYVRGGIYLSSEYTQDTITAVAGQTEFPIVYYPHELSVTVNTVAKTVGIENIDAPGSHDFLLNYNDKLLKKDTIVFTGGEAVVMKYKYEIPVLVMVEDIVSQNNIKAIAGGDGVFEHMIVDKNINTLEGARQKGFADILQYSTAIIEGTFITYYDGFRTGQKLHIKLTDRNIDEYYLIKSVVMESIGMGIIIYTVTFATLIIGFSWLLIKLLDDSRGKENIDNEILDKIRYILEQITISDIETDTLKTPPFKWSNDIGTTVNKLIWSEGTWAS